MGYLGLMAILFVGTVNMVKEPLIAYTARMTAWMLRLLGENGQADGTLVTSSLSSFQIILECTAAFPVIIFVAAVFAYPCAFLKKLLGVAIGVPILVLVNLVRLVSLFYVARWFPRALDATHLLVWQTLMIFCTVVLWLIWARRFVSRESRSS